jgi:hypothetical protein
VSSREADHPDKQQPYFDESLVINTRLNEIERQQREEKREQQEYNRNQLRFNKLLAIFTGLLFLTSLVANILMLRYVNITKEAADAANISAQEVKRSREVAESNLIQSREGVAKAERQSRDSLNASINASRLDQRAWVGVDIFKAEPEIIEVGKRTRLVLSFKNTGKTPARNIKARAIMEPIPKGRLPRFSYAGELIAHYGLLAPSALAFVRFELVMSKTTREPGLVTQAVLDELILGKTTVYVHGRIDYEDIFGCPHWMTFCASMMRVPGPITFGMCSDHNDTDARECTINDRR